MFHLCSKPSNAFFSFRIKVIAHMIVYKETGSSSTSLISSLTFMVLLIWPPSKMAFVLSFKYTKNTPASGPFTFCAHCLQCYLLKYLHGLNPFTECSAPMSWTLKHPFLSILPHTTFVWHFLFPSSQKIICLLCLIIHSSSSWNGTWHVVNG